MTLKTENPTCTNTPNSTTTSSSTNKTPVNKVISVSAPGKVLLAGGYLVLERPNCAIVLATTSRFHSTICLQKQVLAAAAAVIGGDINPMNNKDQDKLPINVYSPQFQYTFEYWLLIHHPDTINKNDQSSSSSSSHLDTTLPVISLISRNPCQKQNTFIEKTLLITLALVLHMKGKESFLSIWNSNLVPYYYYQDTDTPFVVNVLTIQLRADNDFYSQIHYLQSLHKPFSLTSIESLPPFLSPLNHHHREEQHPKTTITVHKTGLGSSAALVTCLVSSILVYFDLVQLPFYDKESSTSSISSTSIHHHHHHHLQLCHNIAQLCHSFAQGKIGSGFDISAAIYGTHVYTRFDPEVILHVMDQIQKDNINKETSILSISKDTLVSIHECIYHQNPWNSIVEPFVLWNHVELLLADVCGGSESPSMARQVLEWKKKNHLDDHEKNPWNLLIHINQKLRHLFLSSSCPYNDDDDHLVTNLDDNSISYKNQNEKQKKDNFWISPQDKKKDDSTTFILQDIRTNLIECRKQLKRMGILAGVDIEPDFQTKLANDCMKLPGVIAAGVPGAGGNDALYVLYIKDDYHNQQQQHENETDINNSNNCDEVKERQNFLCSNKDKKRENIVNFWSQWCIDYKKEYGDEVTICPLTSKSSTNQGVCQTNLEW